MPHLRFRAVEEVHVAQLSDTLLEPLAFTLNCPEDYFTFEYLPTQFYYAGQKVKGLATVEIHWFSRSQDIQDLVAQMVHEGLQKLGYEETSVIFTELRSEAYYDNGQHY